MIEGKNLGRQQGQLGTMLAITIASLHLNQIIDGKELARTFRLNTAGGDNTYMVAVADLIDRTIERYNTVGPIELHGID